MKKQGFSLIETIITLLLIGILLSFISTSFATLIQKNETKSQFDSDVAKFVELIKNNMVNTNNNLLNLPTPFFFNNLITNANLRDEYGRFYQIIYLNNRTTQPNCNDVTPCFQEEVCYTKSTSSFTENQRCFYFPIILFVSMGSNGIININTTSWNFGEPLKPFLDNISDDKYFLFNMNTLLSKEVQTYEEKNNQKFSYLKNLEYLKTKLIIDNPLDIYNLNTFEKTKERIIASTYYNPLRQNNLGIPLLDGGNPNVLLSNFSTTFHNIPYSFTSGVENDNIIINSNSYNDIYYYLRPNGSNINETMLNNPAMLPPPPTDYNNIFLFPFSYNEMANQILYKKYTILR